MMANSYTFRRIIQVIFYDSATHKVGKQAIADRSDDTIKHFDKSQDQRHDKVNP